MGEHHSYQSKRDKNQLDNICIGHADHLTNHGVHDCDPCWCYYGNCEVKVHNDTQAGTWKKKTVYARARSSVSR